MDHILENEGKPVPDLSSVTSSSSGSGAQPMDVDEDEEDAEALRALTGKSGIAAASGTDAEAKVHISCITDLELINGINII
jgi:UBX domain-containing protein 1/4